MTRGTRRGRFVFVLAVLGLARAVAEAATQGAVQEPAQDARQTAAPAVDRIGGRDEPGLRRLEAVLEKRLDQGKSALPLPWHETILKPKTARLVWRPRTLPSPAGVGGFRVAIDPPTRWYFVAGTGSAGAPLTFYGPLEEGAKGAFVEALATTAPAATVSRPADQASAKPGGKGKSRTKPESKSKAHSKPKPPSKTKTTPKAR